MLREGQYQRVHFVGVGGTGMAPLARIFHDAGRAVTGSDLNESAAVRWLEEAGIVVYRGHRAENVGDADLVIISSAVPADNAEVVKARERGLPVMKRAEALGALTRERKTIAIGGTHGKTTTTAMAALILTRAGGDPSYMVGGDVPELGGSGHWGSGDWLVTEADEFDGSFLRFAPRVGVITSIEADHLDFYGSLEAVVDAFTRFAALPGPEGSLVVCVDDRRVRTLAEATTTPVLSYGLDQPALWRAMDVCMDETGSHFVVHRGDDALGEVALRVPGRHNVANALAAVAATHVAGAPFAAAVGALAGFGGARRRFEVKGRAKDVVVVDDYGHHPTEIAATLAAARTRKPGRLCVVFQPHTYHRTKALLGDFAKALEAADVVVVTDVYMPAGREVDTLGISSADVVAAMHHPDTHYVGAMEEAVSYVCERLRPGDMLLTMGAGNIFRLGEEVLARLGRE
ncbi:MAG: UDP-N-acetylmuramate--L-alanine ligase [Chloroflexota bacterium]